MSTLSPAPTEPGVATPTRSTFITVLAWISIVLAGWGTFIALFQAAMYLAFFRQERSIPNRGWPGQEQLPVILQFFFSNPEIFFIAFWSLTLFAFIAAIGLLRRKNWARFSFIALLAFGIAWELSGLWVQGQMLAVLPSTIRGAPPDLTKGFEATQTIISIGSTAFAILVAALFAWLIKRLASRAVRAEFHAL